MPVSHDHLWGEVIAWDNLLKAHYAASRGKRYRRAVLAFAAQLEERLIEIQNRLIWKSWRPGPWRVFHVLDPKPRLIQAPQYADRLVHHALVRVIEPLFERRFIYDSYACRQGKGVHAAIHRLQTQLRVAQRSWGQVYVLQADIARFFASVNHDRLRAILARTIADRDVLWLCDSIIGADGAGIPVGALTSQLFANAYLDQLDHWVKDQVGERFYLRYMDDFIILGPEVGALHALRLRAQRWLSDTLDLSLNPKTAVYPAGQGIDFCGYRTWSTHILPRRRNVARARRHLRALLAQSAPEHVIGARLASFLGYMRHCSGQRTTAGVVHDLSIMMRQPP